MALFLQHTSRMAYQSSNTAAAVSKPKVLSVCNDNSVLRTRGMVLQNAGYCVSSAEDYGQAVDQSPTSDLHVPVIRTSLPYDDRIALAPEVKKRSPPTHVVMY